MSEVTPDLKLVLDVTESIKAVHVPISRETFYTNLKTFGFLKRDLEIFKGQDKGVVGGALLRHLRDDSGDKIDTSMLEAELKRLTLIHASTEQGGVPVDIAVSKGIIDDETWLEVSAQIIFFICHYMFATKSQKIILEKTTLSNFLMRGQTTLFPSTAPQDSSATLTTTEPLNATKISSRTGWAS